MGEIIIELLLDAKPIKKRPYKLDHKYKAIVKQKIDMLKDGIIHPIDQSKWDTPTVVQTKKHDTKKLRSMLTLYGLTA